MDLLQKNVSFVGTQKNAIYSKLVSNPFKDINSYKTKRAQKSKYNTYMVEYYSYTKNQRATFEKTKLTKIY